MISAFESLFVWAERIIKAKPLVATIGGGMLPTQYFLPLLLSQFSFKNDRRMICVCFRRGARSIECVSSGFCSLDASEILRA